jgi:hypothetical protein
VYCDRIGAQVHQAEVLSASIVAIKGRDVDGRYDLGELHVTNGYQRSLLEQFVTQTKS